VPDDQDARIVRAAAVNNGALCDAVCRSHGIAGERRPDAWSWPTRTPEYYPDVVTLDPTADAASLLTRIDAGPGASVKDSFASLDLTAAGFRVLFSAQWITRPMAQPQGVVAASGVQWSTVTDERSLTEWEAAWIGDGASRGRFRPELLTEPHLVVLRGQQDGATVAGAIANGAGDVVGVSNLFATAVEIGDAWAGCLDVISARFPECMVVGYESGPMLDLAHQAGFRSVGPLRVWITD
jgi:hypothetical protein